MITKTVERLEEVTEIPVISRAQAVRIGLQLVLKARDEEIQELVSKTDFPSAGRPRRDGLPPLGYLYLKSLLLGKNKKPERLYRVRFDKQSVFCPQWRTSLTEDDVGEGIGRERLPLQSPKLKTL